MTADPLPLADDDFEGGNIVSAINVPSAIFQDAVKKLAEKTLKDKERVVLHCHLSQQRGPKAARVYAETVDEILKSKNNGGHSEKKQEIFVLRDGFGGFGPKYKVGYSDLYAGLARALIFTVLIVAERPRTRRKVRQGVVVLSVTQVVCDRIETLLMYVGYGRSALSSLSAEFRRPLSFMVTTASCSRMRSRCRGSPRPREAAPEQLLPSTRQKRTD